MLTTSLRDHEKWIHPHDRPTPTSYPAVERAAWKRDVQAARQTCRIVACSFSLKAALFFEFHIYFSLQSLRRLQAIAEHADLKRFVRRVDFMHPQTSGGIEEQEFNPSVASMIKNEFMAALDSKRVKEELYSRFRSEDLYYIDFDPVSTIQDIADRHIDGSIAKEFFYCSFTEYVRIFEEERAMLYDRTYEKVVTHWLSTLPNVVSFILCGGGGSLPATSWSLDLQDYRNLSPTWLEQNHPRISFKSDDFDRNVDPKVMIDFQCAVFRILQTAKGSVRYLAFTQEMVWPADLTDDLKEYVHGLDFSNLQGLKIALGGEQEAWQPISTWKRSLLPLLSSVTGTLRSLHLSGGDPFCASISDVIIIDTLQGLRFPHLRQLHLSGFSLEQGPSDRMRVWLQSHVSLQRLELSLFCGDIASWRKLFEAIRQHPGLTKLHFNRNYCNGRSNLLFDITTGHPAWAGEQGIEWCDNLEGSGPMTETLKHLYGMSAAAS